MKTKNLILTLILLFLLPVSGRSAEEPAEPAPSLAGISTIDLSTAQRIALAANPDMAAALST